MNHPIPLLFDQRDKPAVIAHLEKFHIVGNAWEFAQAKAREAFDGLLKAHQPIIDYLGGKPLDSTIDDGVLRVVHKGLAVVFVLSTGRNAAGSLTVYAAADLPISDDAVVIAKFWIAASAVVSEHIHD